MRGSVFITVKFTVIIMIIMVIITAINTVISFRDLSRWSCDHRCKGVPGEMPVMNISCGMKSFAKLFGSLNPFLDYFSKYNIF